MVALILVIKSKNQEKHCILPTVCMSRTRQNAVKMLWSNQYTMIDLKCINLSAVDVQT